MTSTPFRNAIVAAILARAAKRPAIDAATASPMAIRADLADANVYWNEIKPTVALAADVAVPGPRGAITVRHFEPRPAAEPRRPILYAHGGGWAAGNLDTHDRLCRLIALCSSHPVLSIDYGLSPEVPFPGARDDVAAVIAHVRRGGFGSALSSDGYALAGDSSGAHIALHAALAERDAGRALPHALALAYPALVHGFDSASHQHFGSGAHGLSTARMEMFWRWHVGGLPAHLARNADLATLALHAAPPTLIIAAGLDCLRDDARALADRLTDAAVPFNFDHVADVPHGFLQWSRELPEAELAIVRLGAFLARHLA